MLRLGKVKSKLYLDCVSSKDEAKYSCVAETPYERITQNTYLQIGKYILFLFILNFALRICPLKFVTYTMHIIAV